MIKERRKLAWPSWVRQDDDLIRYIQRITNRNRRYPNWRQVYYECSGMCQYPVDENVCGEMETLEFHEVYRDDDSLSLIVLICNYHHRSLHNGIVNPRHFPSMLQIDIDIEITLAGDITDWIKKYNIIDRRTNYDITLDSGQNKDDIQPSKDSQDNGS